MFHRIWIVLSYFTVLTVAKDECKWSCIYLVFSNILFYVPLDHFYFPIEISNKYGAAAFIQANLSKIYLVGIINGQLNKYFHFHNALPSWLSIEIIIFYYNFHNGWTHHQLIGSNKLFSPKLVFLGTFSKDPPQQY